MLVNALNELEVNKEAILEKPSIDFEAWCQSIDAVHVPLAGNHAERVLNSYFSGSSPFRQVKYRNDIPDVFIYEIVKDLSVDSLFVVCQDENLRKACGAIPNVINLKTIDDLLAQPEIAELIVKASVDKTPKTPILVRPNIIDKAKEQLAVIGARSVALRQGLVGQLIDQLLRTQIQSSLIASNDHMGEVVRAAIADMYFHLSDASYYGDEKFSFAFDALGAVSLQYYVDEDLIDRVQGGVVRSRQVYKNIEQVEVNLSAHIKGRAILQIDVNAVESDDVLRDYKILKVDEIQEITLSESGAESHL
jgi:hypothetical protein